MLEPSGSVIDRDDILAHLFFATGTSDELLASSALGDFTGQLQTPLGDSLVLAHRGHRPVLTAGTAVCLEHVGAEEKYHFYSEVIDVNEIGVHMRLPHAIERCERRSCERLVLPAGAGFAFRMADATSDRVYAVYDLSSGGLAFEQVEGSRLAVGGIVTGELLLPFGAPLPLTVQVRHIQNRRDECVVGVHIQSIGWADRGRLSHVLATWSA
jgi:hypothetical protein